MTNIIRFFLLLLLLLTIPANAVLAADSLPKPTKTDRCPVCGMFVLPYPNWVATMEFRDGSHVFFDGPKDMFRYYLNLGSPLAPQKPEDVSEVFVTDYYSTRPIPARDAFFVMGSDILGPMGNELVPHASRDHAETFNKDHGGRQVLTFDEVSQHILDQLQ